MAIHGFKCDEVNTADPQVSIANENLNVLSFRTIKIRGKGGVTAIIFRVKDKKNIDSNQRQITLNELRTEIRREDAVGKVVY